MVFGTLVALCVLLTAMCVHRQCGGPTRAKSRSRARSKIGVSPREERLSLREESTDEPANSAEATFDNWHRSSAGVSAAKPPRLIKQGISFSEHLTTTNL